MSSPHGRWCGETIHHDRNPVFTIHVWRAGLLLKDQARVSCALGGAKDNIEMKAFKRRLTPALADGARESESRSLLLDVQSLTGPKQPVGGKMVLCDTVSRHLSSGGRECSQNIVALQPGTQPTRNPERPIPSEFLGSPSAKRVEF